MATLLVMRPLSASLCLLIACSGRVSNQKRDAGRDSSDAASDASAEPFSCELVGETPTLEPKRWLNPSEPVAGETLTLALKSQNTSVKDAPALQAEIRDRNGSRVISDPMIVGDAAALFYFSFGDLAEGESCVVVRAGDNVEAAFKVDAAKALPLSPGNGVWKIRSNHQWRCDEQPEFGNLLTVRVVDEEANPLEGITVNLQWTDDVVFPVAPDDSAQDFQQHGQPKSMTTNAEGVAELLTPWGTGIRSPVDSKPGYVVFNVSIAGGASDVATEISTGIWDSDPLGCDYCAQDLVNTYGHWSYTVEFERQPNAREICEVGTDHAGQMACSFRHFYHDPARPSCLQVAN